MYNVQANLCTYPKSVPMYIPYKRTHVRMLQAYACTYPTSVRMYIPYLEAYLCTCPTTVLTLHCLISVPIRFFLNPKFPPIRNFIMLVGHSVPSNRYKDYKRPLDSYACPNQSRSYIKINKYFYLLKIFITGAILREKAVCVRAQLFELLPKAFFFCLTSGN